MADPNTGYQSGRLMTLEIPDPAGDGTTYIPVASAQENSMTIENGEVDASNKDSKYRQLLASGTSSMNTSVNGIYKGLDAGTKRFAEIAVNDEIVPMRLRFDDGEMFEGPFQIGSYERTGNHQEATTFSCDLKSAGEYTHTPPSDSTTGA